MESRQRNYIPALEQAFDLLKKHEHANCALGVFFLSDGEPTDAKHLHVLPKAADKRIMQKVKKMALEFGNRLHFLAAGFASNLSNFHVLQSMVTTVEEANPGGATFMHYHKMYSAVGSAVSSLVQSTTVTLTALQAGARQAGKTSRGITAEDKSSPSTTNQWCFFYIDNHYVFDPNTKKFFEEAGMPPGAITPENALEALSRKEDPPEFLAMNRHHCGEGAERVAFRCYLSDNENEESFVFEPMVAVLISDEKGLITFSRHTSAAVFAK